MIVAGRGAAGRTCLGFVLPKAKVSFTCPGDQVGFVVASAQPSFGTRTGRGFPLFLMGVSRGDVSRIVVTAPSVSQTVHRDGHVTREPLSRQEVYKRGDGWWGTFSLTLSNSYLRAVPGRPWRMRIDFYGDHGLLASRFLAFARPGDRVVAAVSRS